jgi:hemerythrin
MDPKPLGLAAVDAEHQVLHGIIAELEKAVADSRPMEEVSAVLEKLTAAAAQHFASEEQHMRQHEYPKAEDHALEHGQLLHALDSIQRMYKGEEIPLDVSLVRVVWDWQDGHVASSDERYARFVLHSEL